MSGKSAFRSIFKLVFILLVVICASLAKASERSQLFWEPGALNCPVVETETQKYIEVPLIHDLKSVARIDRIPGLNTHDDLLESEAGKTLELFYETLRPLDPGKETIFFVPGGPGQTHEFIHLLDLHLFGQFTPEFAETFNIVVMDHRGVGCSRPTFPGDEPPQSLYMRYAASDMELIKNELLGEGSKIHVWGGSYGTMLSQTYALLYPDSLKSLMLWGAMSSYKDFSRARQQFEGRLMSTVPLAADQYPKLKEQHLDLAQLFVQNATEQFYSFEGRKFEIHEILEKALDLLTNKSVEAARDFLIAPIIADSNPRPWMSRSIMCGELFSFDHIYPGEVFMFGPDMAVCREYRHISELFHYTDLLYQIEVPTFLYSNFFDHVTTYDSMIRMAQELPNNYFYLDRDSGHGVDKPECFSKLTEAFFLNHSRESLDEVAFSKTCQSPPALDAEE